MWKQKAHICKCTNWSVTKATVPYENRMINQKINQQQCLRPHYANNRSASHIAYLFNNQINITNNKIEIFQFNTPAPKRVGSCNVVCSQIRWISLLSWCYAKLNNFSTTMVYDRDVTVQFWIILTLLLWDFLLKLIYCAVLQNFLSCILR